MHAVLATRRTWLPSPRLLFLLPSLLLIIVFFVLPISLTGIISLTSLDYRFRWDFVGLANFLALLQDAIIPRVLLNTGGYGFTTLLLFHLGLGLGLALLTAALPERPAVILRLIWLLPRFTPSVVYILTLAPAARPHGLWPAQPRTCGLRGSTSRPAHRWTLSR